MDEKDRIDEVKAGDWIDYMAGDGILTGEVLGITYNGYAIIRAYTTPSNYSDARILHADLNKITIRRIYKKQALFAHSVRVYD